MRLHYSGIELIAEAEISADTDSYLKDHCFRGDQIVPAVLGMEAMAQVASALEETKQSPQFHNLRFNRPIIVPLDKSIVLRVAAVRRRPGVIAVAVRSSTTSFHVDHFAGECVYGASSDGDMDFIVRGLTQRQILPLVPEGDLYGRILFHHGRFLCFTDITSLKQSGVLLESPAPENRSGSRVIFPATCSWAMQRLAMQSSIVSGLYST